MMGTAESSEGAAKRYVFLLAGTLGCLWSVHKFEWAGPKDNGHLAENLLQLWSIGWMTTPSGTVLGIRDHLRLLVTTFTPQAPAPSPPHCPYWSPSYPVLAKYHGSLKTHSTTETSVLLPQPAGFGVGGNHGSVDYV